MFDARDDPHVLYKNHSFYILHFLKPGHQYVFHSFYLIYSFCLVLSQTMLREKEQGRIYLHKNWIKINWKI